MKKILVCILTILIIIFGILVYSRFLGIKGLKTNEILIQDTIPQSFDGLKIVHFADIHYKKVITEKQVSNLVKEINRLKPDIVIFSGDLLDKDYSITGNDIKFLVSELSSIEAKYGSYAVLGDQDISYQEEVNNIYLQSDFILLENDSVIIQNENYDRIQLIGISKYDDIEKVIDSSDKSLYHIVIMHEPDYVDSILDYHIPLVLSSHSIGGSINIPLIRNLLLPNGAKKYYKSYYKVSDTKLYISNGIGLNHVNFRFMNTPSINFYRFKKNS